jgi:hypothetical protein
MNKLRSRLNAGCALLLTSGVALSLAFRPIDSAIHWIVEEAAILREMAPTALAAIKAIALIVIGPLILGALTHILNEGLGRTLARILSFWWTGLKSGISCLLLFLPAIIAQQVLRHSAGPGVLAAPGSAVAWLYALSWVVLCVSAPFWALLLIRHLPLTVLRVSPIIQNSPFPITSPPPLFHRV